MARYRGPKTKKARSVGSPIYGSDKYFEKKNYPPGQHGINKKRKKTSEYGMQLMEKQKAKYTYGLLERQFARVFDQAQRAKGVTGEVLLQLLESRLDNVVYRLGLARTRNAARQLVLHKHITVNGRVVNIPSFQLKPGDIVSVREKSRSLEIIADAISTLRHNAYGWLEWNAESMSGKFLNVPPRADIPENINEQYIVELYSK